MIETQKTVMPNKVTLVECIKPDTKKAYMAVKIKVGSGMEEAGQYGVAHLLEHLCFQGTDRYTADEIAAAIERYGASSNAHTSHEETVFHISCMDEHVSTLLPILLNLTFNATFLEEAVENERKVVLQEIKQAADSPASVAWNGLYANLMPNSRYSRPVSGTIDDVSALTIPAIREFRDRHYVAANTEIHVAWSGKDRDDIRRIIDEFHIPSAPATENLPSPVITPAIYLETQPREQAVVYAGYVVGEVDVRLHVHTNLLTTLLGYGSASPFFRQVRTNGFAYNPTISVTSLLSKKSVLYMAASTAGHVSEIIETFSDILEDDRHLTEEALFRAKNTWAYLLAEDQTVQAGMTGLPGTRLRRMR